MVQPFPRNPISQTQFDDMIKSNIEKIESKLGACKILIQAEREKEKNQRGYKIDNNNIQQAGRLYIDCIEELGKHSLLRSVTPQNAMYDLSTIKDNFLHHPPKIQEGLNALSTSNHKLRNSMFDPNIFDDNIFDTEETDISWKTRLNIDHSGMEDDGSVIKSPLVDINTLENNLQTFEAKFNQIK